MPRSLPVRFSLALVLLMMMVICPRAWGQDALSEDQAAPVQAQPDPTSGPIDIQVETFGVGNEIRVADYCGLRLNFTDNGSDKPRNVAVRLYLKDDDGDTMICTRRITLNPGKTLGAWLYFRVPKGTQPTSVFTVSVNAVDDSVPAGLDAGAGILGQLAVKRITPGRVLDPPELSMIGVVGRRSYGLDQYELRSATGERIMTGHEPSRVMTGIVPRELPDHWIGLAPFETILWTEGQPEALDAGRPEALREWVNRGGHLVVVLPTVGSSWFAPSNPLSDLMPSATVVRHEDASYEPYRNLLTTGLYDDIKMPKALVQSFMPAGDATPAEASEIISGPDGCVVVRRLVGTGMVTIIGLDLGADPLPASVLRADAFWHRILGKRYDIIRRDRVEDEIKLKGLGFGATYVDWYTGPAIAATGKASVGVLLGLVVFAIYWIVAGPGGFAMLKARGATRHAWVVFTLLTLVFTVIAWAGATAIKPKRVEAQHLTYLDHVYGQPVQRTRTWAGLLLPVYGDQRITLGAPGADEKWRQAITVWSDPRTDSQSAPFPDARSYSVDVTHLETMRVPARATVKQIQADWLGGPRWGMPVPVTPEDAPKLRRLESKLEVTGKLAHKLPAPLTNIYIIVVTGEGSRARDGGWNSGGPRGVLPSEAFMLSLSSRSGSSDWSWAAGTELDLAAVIGKDLANPSNRIEKSMETFAPTQAMMGLASTPPTSLDLKEAMRYDMLTALFPMMQQPEYEKTSSNIANVRRDAAQTLDLGEWFTQPCIIILGQMVDAPSPTPIYVEGQEAPSKGRTVLRWVYPLPSAPPRFDGTVPAPLGPRQPAKKSAPAASLTPASPSFESATMELPSLPALAESNDPSSGEPLPCR